MKLIKYLSTTILGSRDDFSFEEKFVHSINFYGAILCFLSIFGNISLDLSINSIVVVTTFFILLVIGFVISRFFKKFLQAKWILTISGFIFCNIYWYANYGSRGSALFIYLVYFTSMIFIWGGYRIKIITAIVFINIFSLFIVELYNPYIAPFYPSEYARLLDSYSGLFIFMLYLSVLVLNAKNYYIEQYEKAQHSERLKSAFLANMSHEIRTPLNAIMGFSELLARTEQSKENKERFSKIILDNGNYLSKLVSDILDVSLIEAGQMKLELEKTDLNDLLFKIHQAYESKLKKIDKKKIALVLNIPSVPVYLETDAFRLEQIIHNLVSNAIKFTESGSVVMGYQPKGSYVLFYIEDTGSGIKEEFKQNVFKRFVKQEEPSDKKFESGTGIGLALSKNLVEILGGVIGFDSEYQKGSTFYFSIPFKNYTGLN